MPQTVVNEASTATTPFLGLAPFLRMSIAGEDLMPLAREFLVQAESRPEDAALWMNLSTAMLCLGQRELGLSIQQQALEQQRIFTLPAAAQPARFRLLQLMMPGDLAENTPIDCLLENSDIDLIFYYLTPDNPLALPIPDHDAVIVSIGDSPANRAVLAALGQALANWPKPVINAPGSIPSTERTRASHLLQNVPGLCMPMTHEVGRDMLQSIASGRTTLVAAIGEQFPIILRPLGSQAGRDLEKIDDIAGLAAYLAKVPDPAFFVARFVDYRSADGLFRKFRIALIDGRAFPCHMAASENWMVHYVNAGMYEDADKRLQEAAFMTEFADFARRHQGALAAVHRQTGLDYLCIDCAELQNGDLLIFEVDHVMVVHAMDPEDLFPYKKFHMHKVQQAFRDHLFSLKPRSLSAEAGQI